MKRARQSIFRNGFTLVELLVVMAVIALLIGLLIPAVNSVRESARLMQCRGNLRQVAQACMNYANASGVMPTAGTSGRLGDSNSDGMNWTPAQKLSARGGWLYLILPFIEQQPLYDLGAGLTGGSLAAAVATRIQTPVALYTCASRGSALFVTPPIVAWQTAYPGISYSTASGQGLSAAVLPPFLARSDFAGCWAGQGDNSNAALGRNPWSDTGRMLEEIKDGQANVFLCGERYLRPEEYRPEPLSSPTEWVSGRRVCNDKGWSVCHEGDVYASGGLSTTNLAPPVHDSAGLPSCLTTDSRWAGRFGSPHAGVPMATVDGAVRLVSFDVSPAVFYRMCVINDGAGAADELE